MRQCFLVFFFFLFAHYFFLFCLLFNYICCSIIMDSRELNLPKYMVYCGVIAGIGAFSNGWTIGSPNVPGDVTHNCPTGSAHTKNPAFPDCLPMSTSLWGFAVASFCVGGLIGSAVGGSIQTRLGRRLTIIVNNAGFILGAILIGCAVHTAMFIIGRILCGLSCGLGSLVIPTYLGEISTRRGRGLVGFLNQFFVVTGILLSSIIGLPTANVPLWRLNYAIVAIPAIFQVFMMGTCVESPRYLISVHRMSDAMESLQKLRGAHADVSEEFLDIVVGQFGRQRGIRLLQEHALDKNMQSMAVASHGRVADDEGFETAAAAAPKEYNDDVEANGEDQQRPPMSIIEIFRDPVIRKISIIVLVHHMIQQLSGMNAVMYYSTTIFEQAVDKQNAQYMAIYTTVVNFGMSIVAMLFIDRMGRRPLLLMAEAGTCIFSVLLVVGYKCNSSNLLVASVFIYVASFAIGIGPVPWMITSELSPIYASSSVGAVATAMNWAMNFLIGQVFPVIFAAIQGWSFLIFAVICFMAFLFTFFFLPETKNRAIEDIVASFQKKH
ncbi:major facilitator superfamily domain-containing protein [Mycotypha africana]|uniref:major facilitator superfamily domain-containing protein n=1 Tax=Mycotypha africana TaxID=64632 RepID=UPI002301A508|nr:major facilitator superfamily domain-containing protein [Mycotypha africana]KAI8968848.1 major facilitator superfamily domain-containing protein [Mycotypha africana]